MSGKARYSVRWVASRTSIQPCIGLVVEACAGKRPQGVARHSVVPHAHRGAHCHPPLLPWRVSSSSSSARGGSALGRAWLDSLALHNLLLLLFPARLRLLHCYCPRHFPTVVPPAAYPPLTTNSSTATFSFLCVCVLLHSQWPRWRMLCASWPSCPRIFLARTAGRRTRCLASRTSACPTAPSCAAFARQRTRPLATA